MKIQNAYGTKNKREKELAKENREMSKHFEDTFDTEDVLLNGKPFKLMIVKDTDGNTYKKKIKSPHDQKFNLGDYIEWNGQMWLVTLLDPDEKTWNRGYMYQCTILLRWQNKDGKIIERYGYSEDFTKYSTGTTGNSTLTLGDYQYGITLPVDEETKFVKRDKRFPIDIDGVEPPDVYKLTNRKVLLTDDRAFGRGGILTWTLSFHEFNPEADIRVKLDNGTYAWICDYVEPANPDVSDETSILTAKISGSRDVKVGFPRVYTAEIFDSDGSVLPWNDSLYSWNIVSDFHISYSTDKNRIKILIDDDFCVGEKFKLQLIVNRSVNVETLLTVSAPM